MLNFNLIKIIIYLCFHEHKNTKLNIFNPILKREIFRVLHYPPNLPISKIMNPRLFPSNLILNKNTSSLPQTCVLKS